MKETEEKKEEKEKSMHRGNGEDDLRSGNQIHQTILPKPQQKASKPELSPEEKDEPALVGK